MTLDAAWKAAEEALPEGWGIGIEPGPGGYEAGAGKNVWEVWDHSVHPTPAAALLSLARKLREQITDARPDPSWQTDAEGYVIEPLVNRGTK